MPLSFLMIVSLLVLLVIHERLQVVDASAASKNIRRSFYSSLLKAQKGARRGSNLRGLQANNDDAVDDDFFDGMNMIDNTAMNGKAIPNDAYHCNDPSLIEDYFWKDKTVECDWDTHEWALDKLDESKIPEHCIEEGFVFTTVQDLKDWQEPCYLWMTLYGGLPVSTTTANVNSTSTKTRKSAHCTLLCRMVFWIICLSHT
jgi:hypothetical protein